MSALPFLAQAGFASCLRVRPVEGLAPARPEVPKVPTAFCHFVSGVVVSFKTGMQLIIWPNNHGALKFSCQSLS